MAPTLMHMAYVMWLENQAYQPTPSPTPVPPGPEPIILPPRTYRAKYMITEEMLDELEMSYEDAVETLTTPSILAEIYELEESQVSVSVVENSKPSLVVDVTLDTEDWYRTYTGIEYSFLAFADTSSVADMESMFQGCTLLTSIPQLDTSNVTSMYGMFRDCTSLTSIPQLDTSNVTSMTRMFWGCTSLTSIPQLDTSNVTDMEDMFWGCTSLTSIPQLDTSNVTTMYDMFRDCTSLTSIPQLDTSNVTNTSFMFYRCTSLTSIPRLDTSNVTKMNTMFRGCTSVEAGMLDFYNNAVVARSYSDCFTNCGYNPETGEYASEQAKIERSQIPVYWGGDMKK
ncbi:MAG: DUF285 domain-containing protein [Fibrobacter sp.]|nr:DUF285 domain-containing protein [Fibrobacter sp.]